MATRAVALAFPLLLVSLLFLLALFAFVGAVSAYAYYSRDLPDPKQLLAGLTFDQQTIVYDRTGQVELARLGDFKREVVAYEDLPPELIDATTAIEDKTFWDNAGFDPVGILSAGFDTLQGRERGASTITQQLVRQRLLPASAFEGSVYERKIREIIQSVRLTQEFPGDEGKREIMAAYLNQNFYGNQSYGVQAAARSYFGKDVKDLDLAQVAILAAIPQSPSAYDLTRNAQEECSVAVTTVDLCPAGKLRLVVPDTSEIVRRRDYVLDLMKTRSVLSGSRHTPAEYDAAKREPVVLVDQGTVPWKAPQFVWQVRDQLAAILCPGKPVDSCDQVDTGGYHVTTTLDYKMQQTTERWVYAATFAPNAKSTKEAQAILTAMSIPKADWGWVLDMRGANLHNAAAGVTDYRTGQVLAYVGSGSYTAPGTKEFQPQFDVLSDGWRQPGSAIKPINYIIGIDDKTMTAATMFMDVVTDFGGHFQPTQADGLERGPVRLREALQFSLNVPSIKAGLINGLDHFFDRSKDFGLHYTNGAIPVTSMGIGTLEVHPIDLLGAYGAIADGGVLMPRTTILNVVDSKGQTIWPTPDTTPKGTKVVSPQAAYIITDILAGNTDTRVNPYWGKWAVYDGRTRRPAAYKTGTTSDNRDVHAYGYLAPPSDPKAPALAVGVWMGNSNNEPDKDTLSLKSSAPLWSHIMRDVSAGMPIAQFTDAKPDGIVTATVDAISGMLPGPFTTSTVDELFIDGTVPKNRDNLRAPVQIDAATGLLWQDGCAGPMRTVGALDFSSAEPAFPQWQKYTAGWAARAAHGVGVRGGPKGTRTSYFYDSSFTPFGRGWGGIFAPHETCTPPPPSPSCFDILGFPIACETPPPGGTPLPSGQPTDHPKPSKSPRP